MSEHATRADQSMFQHLVHCEKVLETFSLYKLPDIDTGDNIVDLLAHISTAVYGHWKILDTNKNLVQFCFLESFYRKQLKSKINDGLKASKELLQHCLWLILVENDEIVSSKYTAILIKSFFV